RIHDFIPYGYDERQFCSPAFNLPVGSLSRTPFGQFPEYHTSADDLNFVKAEQLGESLILLLQVVETLERNKKYLNLNPACEPHLGKRGLYQKIGGNYDQFNSQLAMLWVLNMSDKHNSLLSISEKSGINFKVICKAADLLVESGLLREVEEVSLKELRTLHKS
ncbi:DUF4910 domain-containing protein, partial [Xanthovirga aplysinae]|uniref:DUF4910 domain-containing protein n=1 Tax=Xanthovirga aplysinae TaxID=2529853 RepID=UPI0012BB54E9